MKSQKYLITNKLDFTQLGVFFLSVDIFSRLKEFFDNFIPGFEYKIIRTKFVYFKQVIC